MTPRWWIPVAFIALVCVVILAVVSPAPISAESEFRGEGPVRVIVKLRAGTTRSFSVARGTGGRVVSEVAPDTAVLEMPAGSSADLVASELEARPQVEWAEPDHRYRAERVPNDPCYAAACGDAGAIKQWGHELTNSEAAWDVTTGGRAVTIAVLDSGVDVGHPDLIGHVTLGPDYTGEGQVDLFGHGTHVAGVIGANTHNGTGVAGLSWDAEMVSVKVLDATGEGYVSDIATGLRWATDNGVRIANLSLGDVQPSNALAEAVAYAQGRGVLVVAAAGNEATSTPVYPAALPGVISVGASDMGGQRASFSNFGESVDILAPGSWVVSTWPRNMQPGNPYEVVSGTSMATPFVSGAAALLLAARPYLSSNGVADRLFATVDQVSGSGTLVNSGHLNVGRALSDLPVGYRMVSSDGGVFSFDATFYGSTGSERLNQPIVAATSPGRADGYWLVASDGGVFSYGSAHFHGSTGGQRLNQPIVAAASTGSGSGYWLVASDGGVFSFGDALFLGSTGSIRLARPIVSVVPTATGRGYWLVASDGGVFAFGDARFLGSAGGERLNRPIVGAARSPSGNGYWLVASDGGIFAYGDATFRGSTGGTRLAEPVIGITPSPTGRGYWLVASDGGIFAYGDAPFLGSTGSIRLNRPMIAGMAT